jgi:hypothetical protein
MVKPWRDNLRGSPERDLVRNPCVRGGSQISLYKNWIFSPYRKMLMFVLNALESCTHSLIQSANPSLMLVEESKKKKFLDQF